MVRDGSGQPASPMTRAGTPATVVLCGTDLSTTEPAATRAQCPISILPMILAPAPIMTPRRILGWRSPVLLAGAAERHVVQDRHVVLDHRGLADHQAGRVVEEDAAADARRRMDVGLEHRRGTALQVVGEVLAALAPQPVRQPVRLDGVEALEIEHRLDEAVGRRIAVEGRDDVGAECHADRGSLSSASS